MSLPETDKGATGLTGDSAVDALGLSWSHRPSASIQLVDLPGVFPCDHIKPQIDMLGFHDVVRRTWKIPSGHLGPTGLRCLTRLSFDRLTPK